MPCSMCKRVNLHLNAASDVRSRECSFVTEMKFTRVLSSKKESMEKQKS